MKLVLDFGFRKDVLEDRISDEIQIQTVRVSSGVATLLLKLLRIRDNHAIIGAQWVSNPRPEGFGKDCIVSSKYAALVVHVKLSACHLLTQANLLALEIFDRYLGCLIATSPNNQVSFLQMRPLQFGRLRFN